MGPGGDKLSGCHHIRKPSHVHRQGLTTHAALYLTFFLYVFDSLQNISDVLASSESYNKHPRTHFQHHHVFQLCCVCVWILLLDTEHHMCCWGPVDLSRIPLLPPQGEALSRAGRLRSLTPLPARPPPPPLPAHPPPKEIPPGLGCALGSRAAAAVHPEHGGLSQFFPGHPTHEALLGQQVGVAAELGKRTRFHTSQALRWHRPLQSEVIAHGIHHA